MILDEHYFQVIERNSVQCLECMDHIESKHRHDFRGCSCGNVHVDGGKAYLKRSYRNLDTILDTSIYRNMTRGELLSRLAICQSNKATYTYSTGYIDKEIASIKHYLKEWYS